MTNISKKILNVQQNIAVLANQVDRNANDIQLLAVSKTKPVSLIKQAYQCVLRHFGENYVQESIEKIQQIKLDDDFDEALTWYFIGPLQS
ncbi:MAG: YggS family pyridoxal phosphate-dependent enzyme, partial [Legionella sp.]|nr:YggS family pyridoxal phosphate-dependent enzyme [Legionella sp.]